MDWLFQHVQHKVSWKHQIIKRSELEENYYFNEASRQNPPRPRALCLNDQKCDRKDKYQNKLKQQISLSFVYDVFKHWFIKKNIIESSICLMTLHRTALTYIVCIFLTHSLFNAYMPFIQQNAARVICFFFFGCCCTF